MAALNDRDDLTDTRECHSPELLLVDPPAPRHASMVETYFGAHSQGTSNHASGDGTPPTAALSIAVSSATISAVNSDAPSEANLDTLSRNIATLKRNIEIHKRRNQKLARRVEELEGQKDEADAQCETLEKERDKVTRGRDACVARSDTQDTVRREIDALRLELGRIKRALGDAEEDRNERVRDAQALKLDLDAKAVELCQNEGDLRRQRAELREMGDDLEDKRTELHTLRTALAQSQDARKRTEEDRTRVEGKLSQSNTAREVLSVRASAAEAHAIAAEARAVDAEERADNALERVAEAGAIALSSSARASDAESVATAAEARAAACEERVALAQERTIIAETQEAAIAEELRVAKDALEAAEMQAARAITDKQEMLQSLQVRSTELACIRDELAQSTDELARAHAEIEETKVELAGKEMARLEMQAHFVDLRDRFAEISCRLGVPHSAPSKESSPSRSLSSARTVAPYSASTSAPPYTARVASPVTLARVAASSPSLTTPMLAHPSFSMTRPSSVSASSTGLTATDPRDDPSSGASVEPHSAHSSRAPTKVPATLRPIGGPCLEGEDDAVESHLSLSRGSADDDDGTVRGHHSRSPSASRTSVRQQTGSDVPSLSSSLDDASAPSESEAPLGQNGVDEKSSSPKRPRQRPYSPNAVDVSSISTNKRPRRTRSSKGFPPTSTSSLGRTPLSDRRPRSSRRATRGDIKPVPWETLKPKVREVSTKPRKDTRTGELGSSAGSSVDERGARRCGQCERTQDHLTSPRWLPGPLGPASICQICWRNNRKNT
ncbi:uncharacterized protein SCHCODRAFT_02643567 [Schizophyllum commune H4-8]|uniref:uncharacterized protein n=1 Tax=Schizophyllum commune (strain H4-8 / FGSC 9210) TaxID=578458 RepID=UPI00215EC323|nr:uncharacterized protein SCHCODRAFT_02643567 [Schizophyllum commune H4-8]KAI5886227.1 hypothetical protein SCHCODRAFT_02643567 [Schizophyllum commune H4-8]